MDSIRNFKSRSKSFLCCGGVNGVVVYGGETVTLRNVNELNGGLVIGEEVAVEIDGVAVGDS